MRFFDTEGPIRSDDPGAIQRLDRVAAPQRVAVMTHADIRTDEIHHHGA